MRPTFRAAVLVAASIPLSLVLILWDAAYWPLAIAYLAFAMVLIGSDALMAPSARRMRVETELPALLYIGGTEALGVAIRRERVRGSASVELLADVGANLQHPEAITIPMAGASVRCEIPLEPTRRGMAEVKRLWLRWHGPLGLAWKGRIHAIDQQLPVVPNVRAVRDAAFRLTSYDAFFGMKAQKQQGDGSEFEALRDYVPGLDHRSIDWKQSARHRNLVCKEFRTERNHQIVLAFDTGHLMSEPLDGIPKLDHAVNAGLLAGYMSLRQGDKIGIFAFDAGVRLAADPVGGMAAFGRLQQLAARLDYSRQETNFTLGLAELLGRLKRRSLVILQTEFVDTVTAELMVENLRHLARRHLVLFVTLRDPALTAIAEAGPDGLGDVARSVIAHDFLRERRVVFERLRRLGVHCLEAPRQRVGIDLVNRYLEIKRLELI